ncbi:hypothetical protein BMR85_028315 [Achromobacter sp. KAs 3-5]|nr:hypothetical protein BMR85_028315 [Achromobacter sp. KAs 3-5]
MHDDPCGRAHRARRARWASAVTPASVAIVGGGAAGTLLALHLSRLHGIRVTLFDAAGAFGRGAAYSATSPWHRLNVPALKMGGWHADDPDGFPQWLADRDGGTASSHGRRYVERAVYGEWLSAQLFDAVRAGHVQLVAPAYGRCSAHPKLFPAGN